MIIRTLHMAFKHAFSNRMHLYVNLIGLVLGFTAMFLIGLYLNDELSYDQFHDDSEKIFRVTQFGNYGGIIERSSSCPFPLGPGVQEFFGDKIESYTRLYNYQSPSTQIANRNIVYNDSGFFYTDPGFFDVFTVDTLHSNNEKFLEKPFAAVITKSAAQRYFGYTNVVGKTLSIENHFQVEVQAVVDNWPVNSHFQFSVLVSLSTYGKLRSKTVSGMGLPESWIGNPCWTYIKISKKTEQANIQKRLPIFVNKYFSEDIRDNNALFLQPLEDIHLTSHLEYEISQNTSIVYVYIFAGIAVFLLLMAVINYINLTTATFSHRAGEMALKKVLGASGKNLRIQIIIEALIITIIAALLSLVATELLLPWFNQITAKNFVFADLLVPGRILLFVVIILLVGFAGGFYPAVFISGLRPAVVLKGNLRRAGKSGLSRKFLVVSQLFISTLLVFAALTINEQYKHLIESPNGVNRENILIVHARFTGMHEFYESFKNELEEYDAITHVTASDYIPGIDHNRHAFFMGKIKDRNEMVFLPALRVLKDFNDVYELNIIHGKSFGTHANEVEKSLLINKQMADYLGFKPFENALGASIKTYPGNEQVIGIFDGFYPNTLREKPVPFIIDMVPEKDGYRLGKQYIAVRYLDGKQRVAKKIVHKYLNKYIGRRNVLLNEYNHIYRNQYKDEKIFNQLAGIIAILSLIISSAGLLGLVSFLLIQKSKEISIRKVHGASNKSVIMLIGSEFARIYTVVLIFAIPVAWYLSKQWLSNFASHIDFSILNIVIAAIIIALVIVLVPLLQLQEAARIKPSQILKYE